MKLRLEMWFYKKYAKMNSKRKAKEKTNPVFRAVDNFRRRTGFVR